MLPVEAQVIGEVITSSPSPIPAARNARWRPAVADVTATACAAPTAWAKARSNSSARGPLVIQPERRQAVTAAISASPMLGRESGKNSARTVPPPPPQGEWLVRNAHCEVKGAQRGSCYVDAVSGATHDTAVRPPLHTADTRKPISSTPYRLGGPSRRRVQWDRMSKSRRFAFALVGMLRMLSAEARQVW